MKPLIFTTFNSYKEAMKALEKKWPKAGHCTECGETSELSVCLTTPEGDADVYFVGTPCCGEGLKEETE